MQAFSRIFPVAQPRTWLIRGWHDWLTGKQSQANFAWRKGLRLAQAEHLAVPYEEARAHHEIGRHLKDTIEGKIHLQEANHIYAELGVSKAML